MKKSIKYYINSNKRTSGSHSDFQYKIDIPTGNYTHVSAVSISIPKSFYLVQNNLNTFTVDENGTTTIITIPIGTYTRTSFISTLQTLLNANCLWTYSLTIPETSTSAETGKITYTVSDNTDLISSFIFDTNPVYELMGFEQGTTNVFINNVLISASVINLQQESTLFIHTDMVTSSNDNILENVFCENVSNYGNIIYQNNDLIGNSKYISNIQDSYRFYLTDENDTQIDLNGRNWQLTLIIFEKDNTMDLINRYIKYNLIK